MFPPSVRALRFDMPFADTLRDLSRCDGFSALKALCDRKGDAAGAGCVGCAAEQSTRGSARTAKPPTAVSAASLAWSDRARACPEKTQWTATPMGLNSPVVIVGVLGVP